MLNKIHIDGTSDIPIFQQIVRAIEYWIIGETLEAGTMLPSVRDLAVQCHVNPNTVSKAYQILQSEKLIESERGIGLRVSQLDARVLASRKAHLLQKEIDALFVTAKNLNISPKKLLENVKKTAQDLT